MKKDKIEQWLQEALESWFYGNHKAAKTLCLKILSSNPEHPQANGLLVQIIAQEKVLHANFPTYAEQTPPRATPPPPNNAPGMVLQTDPSVFFHSWEADEAELPLEYDEHDFSQEKSITFSAPHLTKKPATAEFQTSPGPSKNSMTNQQLQELLEKSPDKESANFMLLEALENALQHDQVAPKKQKPLPDQTSGFSSHDSITNIPAFYLKENSPNPDQTPSRSQSRQDTGPLPVFPPNGPPTPEARQKPKPRGLFAKRSPREAPSNILNRRTSSSSSIGANRSQSNLRASRSQTNLRAGRSQTNLNAVEPPQQSPTRKLPTQRLGQLAKAFDDALAKEFEGDSPSRENLRQGPTRVSNTRSTSSQSNLRANRFTRSQTTLPPPEQPEQTSPSGSQLPYMTEKHERLKKLAESFDKKLAEAFQEGETVESSKLPREGKDTDHDSAGELETYWSEPSKKFPELPHSNNQGVDEDEHLEDLTFEEPVFVEPTGSFQSFSQTPTPPPPQKSLSLSPLLDELVGNDNDPIAFETLLAEAFKQINEPNKKEREKELDPVLDQQEVFEELLQHAVGAYLRQDFEQALHLFQECLSLRPNDSRIIYNIERLKKRVLGT